MLGYLRTEKPGVLEPPPEGWYDTGDIVSVDKQGFITILGRAKRFAKIAGETVSLAAVETIAGELWPNALSAVTTASDVKKGERLILVTQQQDATRTGFQTYARSHGAAELMTPAEIIHIEKMPLLGTGKIDKRGGDKDGTRIGCGEAGRGCDGSRIIFATALACRPMLPVTSFRFS